MTLGSITYLLGNNVVIINNILLKAHASNNLTATCGFKTTWATSWESCCKLGMKPISFESIADLQSIGATVSSKNE